MVQVGDAEPTSFCWFNVSDLNLLFLSVSFKNNGINFQACFKKYLVQVRDAEPTEKTLSTL